MIDTDTRQLRRVPGGYTTGAGKHICDHCALVESCTVTPSAGVCPIFMPALPFTDDTGLAHVANTVRIGRAWPQRLVVGQIVALYNSRRKEVFGHAKVLFTEHGPIADMLKRHAHANHIMLDTPRENAGVELLKWLRQNYGPRIVNTETHLTALYLLREHQPPDAPNFQGLETDGQAQGGTAGPG